MSQTPLTIQENQAALQIYEMVIFDVVLQQKMIKTDVKDFMQ